MKKQYHILNGDALKEQFPEDIQGEIIIARECLVDGNVAVNNLNELFASRAKYLSQNYEYTEQYYYEKVAPEFQKMRNIEEGLEINLWFEDDLFCQVNFWFVLHLLNQPEKKNSLFLIRPKKHSKYGFAALDKTALVMAYENRTFLKSLDKLFSLWNLYQKKEAEELLEITKELESDYPFIRNAVKAYIESLPKEGVLGRPSQSILQIMKELKTEEFATVFKEFNRKESIYGFGDLQVKRLFEEIKNNHY